MIKNLTEAKYVQSQIDRLGIQDVVLMYDHQINMWSVNQVFRKPKTILTMDSSNMIETGAQVMFWIKKSDGTYRVPSDQDVSDVVAIVSRAQKWFDKGSDFMIDQMEKREKSNYDKRREVQSKKIRDVAKPLKKAIRNELG